MATGRREALLFAVSSLVLISLTQAVELGHLHLARSHESSGESSASSSGMSSAWSSSASGSTHSASSSSSGSFSGTSASSVASSVSKSLSSQISASSGSSHPSLSSIIASSRSVASSASVMHESEEGRPFQIPHAVSLSTSSESGSGSSSEQEDDGEDLREMKAAQAALKKLREMHNGDAAKKYESKLKQFEIKLKQGLQPAPEDAKMASLLNKAAGDLDKSPLRGHMVQYNRNWIKEFEFAPKDEAQADNEMANDLKAKISMSARKVKSEKRRAQKEDAMFQHDKAAHAAQRKKLSAEWQRALNTQIYVAKQKAKEEKAKAAHVLSMASKEQEKKHEEGLKDISHKVDRFNRKIKLEQEELKKRIDFHHHKLFEERKKQSTLIRSQIEGVKNGTAKAAAAPSPLTPIKRNNATSTNTTSHH